MSLCTCVYFVWVQVYLSQFQHLFFLKFTFLLLLFHRGHLARENNAAEHEEYMM